MSTYTEEDITKLLTWACAYGDMAKMNEVISYKRKLMKEFQQEIIDLGLDFDRCKLFDAFDHQHSPPLIVAATNDHPDIAKKLVNEGASVDVTDDNGMTALHHAAEWRRTDIIRYLMSAKCSVTVKDSRSYTALHYACLYDESRYGVDEFEYDDDYEDRLADARALDSEIIKELIGAGADVNAIGPDGNTPLHYALAKGYNMDALRVLVEKANVRITDNDGGTALYSARSKEHMEFLVEAGWNVHAEDFKGNTPLHVAARRSRFRYQHDDECIPYLLDSGASIDAVNDAGETPLYIVCAVVGDRNAGVDVTMVQTFIDRGANFLLQTKNGKSPLDVAEEQASERPSFEKVLLYMKKHPWYRRRSFIVMRPHKDQIKHPLTPLGRLVTATNRSENDLFSIKKKVASYL